MNKDVLYIEPEDDITDIITKIEHTPEKIAVLVPPKKASIFRSAVNIKLIAKTAASANKTPVIVTTDPSIIKLAAASGVLVTKDLKTPPKVPEIENQAVEDETEVIEDYEAADEESTPVSPVEKPVENSRADTKIHIHEHDVEVDGDADAVEELEEEAPADEGEPKQKKEPKNKFAAWFLRHKIVIAIGAVATCGIVGFLVWAIKFAPAAAISVEVQTERKNFAENVLFTPDPLNENAAEGEFYIQEFRTEQAQEIKFDATGTKNLGEAASGNINVYYNFINTGSVTVPAGATFTYDGLSFSVTKGVTLSFSGQINECHNNNPFSDKGCMRSGTVSVVANGPGTKYNVGNPGNTSSWDNDAGVLVSGSAIGGGTDKEVTVVEQIDVEKAKDQTREDNVEALKERLVSNIPQNMVVIDASFAADTSGVDVSPGVGEEVPDGVTPTLKIVTTASIYALDRSKLEQFIRETAELQDSQRIYKLEDPSIESFVNDGTVYTGRLRTNYYVGPKITEGEVVELAKGKGFGDVQRQLRDMPGVVDVKIDGSYPWVLSVPSDTNKITVTVNIKGQNQNDTPAQGENQDNNNEAKEQE